MQIIALALLVLVLAAYPDTNGDPAMSDTPARGGENRPARDGNIAIRQEFDAAVAENSIESYEFFIARHPDHPLAALAREHLAAISSANE